MTAATSRARELLLLGRTLVDEVGRQAAEPMADVLELMQHASDETSELLAVNQALVPLMANVKKPEREPRWWQWFTGERLEREVFFPDLQRRIEDLAREGERGLAALQRQAQALGAEDARMGKEVARQEADLQAVQLLLSPAYAGACRAAGLADEDLARLARRADNLQAMATANQLTRAQYRVAIEHSRTVCDRFVEIRGLLLPLWKQAMGFELFSQRVAARAEQGS